MTDITEPTASASSCRPRTSASPPCWRRWTLRCRWRPLGSEELLFANKLYRLWFGGRAGGHLQMVAQAGMTSTPRPSDEALDDVDSFVGLPTNSPTTATSENAEIFVPELGKWLEVRSRYLNWVDGRLAQMVIATDITSRRNAEEQAAAQAERAQSPAA